MIWIAKVITRARILVSPKEKELLLLRTANSEFRRSELSGHTGKWTAELTAPVDIVGLTVQAVIRPMREDA